MKRIGICLLGLILLLCSAPEALAGKKTIVKIGEDVQIAAGQSVRNVITFGGQITVSGIVQSHVVALGGSVVLTRTANVGGDVVCLGGVVVLGKGAQIGGTMTEINSANLSEAISDVLNDNWEGWSWIFTIISILVFAGFLILSLLIATLIPRPVNLIVEAIEGHLFQAILWGVLVLILVVPLAVLLTISVVGIVLVPLEMTLVACAALLGLVSVAQLIGSKLLALFKKNNSRPLKEIFWGLLVLWIMGWIPNLGWMIKIAALVIGVGGVFATRFGTHRLVPRPAVPSETA
ncbi:MAG: hypothetical protein A4E72_00518 [Syntrophus sp. PtaU1.Bin208]|nr:MAG: hypothetical protein A4E72_00518 [Syntrophus sp. PtaU1.Bin208]